MIDFEQRVHQFAPRYLEGTGIVSDSRRTLHFLQWVSRRSQKSFDVDDRTGPEMMPATAQAGGIFRSLDSPTLRDLLSQFDEVPRPEEESSNPIGTSRVMGVRIITEVKEIHGGFLEAYEQRWIQIPIRDLLIARMMIKIKGEKDYLVPENHHKRHYHYCNHRGLRTEVILTFDVANSHPGGTPLFWEKHGEGKTQGKAYAQSWRETKRRSIYDATLPDLVEIPHDQFRRPSNKADNVWPLGVPVSPRPSS